MLSAAFVGSNSFAISKPRGKCAFSEAERALPLYDKSLSICFWWVVVRNRWRPGENL
jgi:hypothetical protein